MGGGSSTFAAPVQAARPDTLPSVACEWRPGCERPHIGWRCGVPVCGPCAAAARRAGATVSITKKLRQARRDSGDDFAVTYDEGLLGFTADG